MKRRLRRSVFLLAFGACGAVLFSGIAVSTLAAVIRADEEVIYGEGETLIQLEALLAASERESRAVRGSLLVLDDDAARRLQVARDEFDSKLASLRNREKTNGAVAGRLADVARAEIEFRDAADEALHHARAGGAASPEKFEDSVIPPRRALDRAFAAALFSARAHLGDARQHSKRLSQIGTAATVGSALLGILVAAYAAFSLRRTTQFARALVDDLERVNRDLDQFAGRAAHDVRNVLSPIKLASSLLRKDLAAERRTLAIDGIDRAIDRSEVLLQGLLAFSRGGAPPGPATSNVREVSRDVAEAVASLATAIDARLELAVDDVEVACPRSLLFQVLLNLATNALKHLSERPRREVRIVAAYVEQEVEVAVEDTGPGVPAEMHQQLGNPFFRVPGDRTPGSGIGLATVRRIMEACGGTLSFTAASGGGLLARLRFQRPARR